MENDKDKEYEYNKDNYTYNDNDKLILKNNFSFAVNYKEENNIKENSVINQKFLSVKIPAKVKSVEKAIESLGGVEQIAKDNIMDKDIHFSLLDLDLEKCFSYDYLIKKKRKRNKKDPSKVKYEYKIIGKIPFNYNFFSLCDFVYNKEKTFDTVEYYKQTLNLSEDKLIETMSESKINKEDFMKSNFLDQFSLNKFSIGRNKYQQSLNNTLINKVDILDKIIIKK